MLEGVKRAVLRPGVLLGREGGMIKQIFLPFYLGLGGRMGEGSQPMPWVHVKDLAGLVVHSVKNPQVEGVLNAVSPHMLLLDLWGGEPSSSCLSLSGTWSLGRRGRS